MGHISEGDRVTIDLKARGYVRFINADGTADVRIDGQAQELEYVPVDAITKSVTVGDVLPARTDEPDLPNGTVLVYSGDDHAAIQQHDGLWYFTANFTEFGFEWENITHSPLLVAFVPGK